MEIKAFLPPKPRIVTLPGVLARERSMRARLSRAWNRILADQLGAVTLAQAAVLSQDDLQQGVIETFILESAVLDQVPLEEIEGNAFAYNEETTLPGVEFRAVNSSFAESTGVVSQKTESLVILGGDADVDRFIQRTRSNLNDQRETQLRLKIKAAVRKYQDTFVNGDVAVDANSFDGLKKRLTGNQVVDAAANGLGPVAGGHAFLDALDEALGRVDGAPDALYMNKAIRTKMAASARRLGYYESTRDEFGRKVEFYNGIPMLDIGQKGDGTDIIPFTETQGTATNASSIYAVKWSDAENIPGVMGLFNSPKDDGDPIAVDIFDQLESKPSSRIRIEAYIGMAVFGKGAARLRGVLNA
jgi:hypothetical protein